MSIKARRKELTAEQQQWALSALEVLANGVINWTLVAPVAGDFEVAEYLTAQPALNLRGGDALHIAIARRHDWVLATLDNVMRNAAERAGVLIERELIG